MKPTHTIYTCRITGDSVEDVEDQVASEAPLLLVVNGTELATLLCTPSELEEMAIGFLLSEGLLKEREDLLKLEVDEKSMTAKVTMNAMAEDIEDVVKRKSYTSGCGKGITFSDVRHLKDKSLSDNSLTVGVENIRELLKEFRSISELFRNTGGVHSAALAADDKILMFSEDIGRHNAVDKVVGRMLLDSDLPASGLGLYVSGRASFEMVQKAWAAGFGTVVAVSAPSALAVETAAAAGIGLAGFIRDRGLNLYT